MTIKLTAKQKKTLITAYEEPGHKNGYSALKKALSPSNKATLRALCDTTDYISDRDLIFAIINAIEGSDTGLDL